MTSCYNRAIMNSIKINLRQHWVQLLPYYCHREVTSLYGEHSAETVNDSAENLTDLNAMLSRSNPDERPPDKQKPRLLFTGASGYPSYHNRYLCNLFVFNDDVNVSRRYIADCSWTAQ